MTSQSQGAFEVARIGAGTSLDDFRRDYVDPEIPVVVSGVAGDWPARGKWSSGYLARALAGEAGVERHTVYYIMPFGTLGADYAVPPMVRALLECPSSFPHRMNTRIWINRGGNVSHYHYDADIESVFNVQVTGRKRWTLISPDTPPPFYPFSNFAIMEEEARILAGSRHTTFVLEEGEMLYLPPLWTHSVAALDEENVNLNWTFTKRRTRVGSRALTRDIERYRVHRYFQRHPLAPVRFAYNRLISLIPTYLVVSWRYDELMEIPVPSSRAATAARVLKELALLGRSLRSVPRVRAYLESLDTVAPLDRT